MYVWQLIIGGKEVIISAVGIAFALIDDGEPALGVLVPGLLEGDESGSAVEYWKIVDNDQMRLHELWTLADLSSLPRRDAMAVRDCFFSIQRPPRSPCFMRSAVGMA